MDFFAYEGRPGMFWVVEVGALVTVPVMLFLFRRRRASSTRRADAGNGLPAYRAAAGHRGFLIAASFIPDKPAITNGVICMAFFLVGLILESRRGRLTA